MFFYRAEFFEKDNVSIVRVHSTTISRTQLVLFLRKQLHGLKLQQLVYIVVLMVGLLVIHNVIGL